ncbi:5-formyltetrahydrofolate cyclo-ligase [Atopobacter phocae]|uniref:5-formyltetrahydrofolate cyclo-ligase n=1 Tax=Atopobacter phocae TaxID=136492 RepID=UPI00046E9B34|nr:5-formyltetrahydrofolate cyclo-ligase [Atopobacter phocae]
MKKEKEVLRQQVRESLKQFDQIERQQVSHLLHQQLIQSSIWKEAQVIGTYLSFSTEWDTRELIAQAWKEGKKIAIPKVNPKQKTMTFHLIDSYQQVEKNKVGSFYLEEPIVEKTFELSSMEIDVMIVPGLAFSYNGDRLGYGGGYYDRYIAYFSNQTIALTHSTQLFSNIPTDHFDQVVQHIVTEKGILL